MITARGRAGSSRGGYAAAQIKRERARSAICQALLAGPTGIAGLCERTGFSVRTLRRYLPGLIHDGYVVNFRIKNDNRSITYAARGPS